MASRRRFAIWSVTNLLLAKCFRLSAFGSIFLVCGCARFAPLAYIPPETGATVTVNVLLHTRFGSATLYSASPKADEFGSPVYTVQQILSPPRPSSSQASVQVPENQLVRFVYEEPLYNTPRDCSFEFSFSTSSGYTYNLNAGDSGPPDATTDIGKFGQWLFPLAGKGCDAQVQAVAPDGSTLSVPVQIADRNQAFFLAAH